MSGYRVLIVALGLAVPSASAAQDYVLSLEGMGMREYYCQITVTLENRTAEPLTEISGFFYSYEGDMQVGRSKGAWFMGVEPDATAQATFETPNAPCHDGVRYEFVVGACRFDAGFADKAACAARIGGTGPITVVAPGDS